LIAYNGSDDGPAPSNFVPELATCVPGSAECGAQFGGSELVWNNATTGAPQYYTFEIDAGAHFYDPTTSTGWPVYPSDVVFSFARTMGWADLAFEEQTNGWMNTQDLVPPGNAAWDSSLHAPLNNTPQHILTPFLVNDSTYCPASVTVATNGCVTFNVGGSGEAWPFFLELIAENMGASIEPCGWFSAQGATAPGFLGTNASNGDGPCLLPGNSTSTQQAGYQDYLVNTPMTGWDAFESEAFNWPATQPGVQWNEVGSGPYYVDNPVYPTDGYSMVANPDYVTPVGCAGQPGCMPATGSYVPNVDVVWESGSVGDQTGLIEMQAGQADSAGFYPVNTSQVLSMPNYSLTSGIPSLTIGFFPIALEFNYTDELGIDPIGQLNIPGNFFSNVALRQFLVNAYPYSTVEQTYQTDAGVAYGEPYGGAIPHNMSGDPTNITWPSGSPTSNSSQVGNVTWWWAQATTPGTAWYDPDLSYCSTATPCEWAMFSTTGDPPLDDEFADWAAEIQNLSGGALAPYVVDISSIEQLTALGDPGIAMPLPTYYDGWAPDYPDPSDFMAPMYYPNNAYTYSDSVSESLAEFANNASTCPDDYGAWSNLTYWANLGQIPTACQGAAYDTMVAFMNQAQFNFNLAQRAVEFNLVEQIANKLALYVYDPQSLVAVDYGHWISTSSINTNPMIGGEGVQLWYDWGYEANHPRSNATFTQTGLAAGTVWQVNLSGTVHTSSNSTVTFGGLGNGTYAYDVGRSAGLFPTPSAGSVTIAGGSVSTGITFVSGPTYTLDFSETGLPNGTSWTVDVSGVPESSNGTTIGFLEPNGTSNFSIRPTALYTPHPAFGAVTVAGASTNVTVTFVTTNPPYSVMITESGLPSGASWDVNLSGDLGSSTSNTIGFSEPNGSYTLVVAAVQNFTANYSGTITVSGGPTSVAVTFSNTTYPVSFAEAGLPVGSSWTAEAHDLTTDTSVSGLSTGSVLTLHLADGRFALSVNGPPGYAASLSSSDLLVSGVSPALITVSFVPSSPGGGPAGGSVMTDLVALVGLVIVAVAALGAAVGFTRYRAAQWRTEAKGWVTEFHDASADPSDETLPRGPP